MHIVLLIDHFAKFACFPLYLTLFRWFVLQQQKKKNTHLVVVKVFQLSWWRNTADSGVVGQPQLHYKDAMDDIYLKGQKLLNSQLVPMGP